MMRFRSVSPRLTTSDLEATIAFYRDRLGFVAGECWPADAPTFVLLQRDGVTLQFARAEHPLPDPAAAEIAIHLDVSDADALHEELAGMLPVEWGPEVYWYGRREFAVRDPNGYLVIFSEPTDDPPTCLDET